jgi:hypothetical protein
MILMIVLAAWTVALVVVGGLCVAAGRGDAALRRQLLEPGHEQLAAGVADGTERAAGERRPGSMPHRQAEHERGRLGRVAVG